MNVRHLESIQAKSNNGIARKVWEALLSSKEQVEVALLPKNTKHKTYPKETEFVIVTNTPFTEGYIELYDKSLNSERLSMTVETLVSEYYMTVKITTKHAGEVIDVWSKEYLKCVRNIFTKCLYSYFTHIIKHTSVLTTIDGKKMIAEREKSIKEKISEMGDGAIDMKSGEAI